MNKTTLINMKNTIIDNNLWDWFIYGHFPTYNQFLYIFSYLPRDTNQEKWKKIFHLIYCEYEIIYFMQEYSYLWTLYVINKCGDANRSVLRNIINFERQKYLKDNPDSINYIQSKNIVLNPLFPDH
jgi:hypothetical protein